MKTCFFRLFFTLTFFMSLHTSFAMEYLTHLMQESSKQFDEYSWWVKAPVLFVGTYAFFKSCDALSSKFFGTKVVTPMEVQNLTNALVVMDENILALKKDVLELQEFAHQTRVIDNGRSRNQKKLKKSLVGIDGKIALILQSAEISPRKKRHSWGEVSSGLLMFESQKGKEKEHSLKRKNKNKDASLSPLDKFYRQRGGGTPRDDFTSSEDNEEKGL